MSEFADRFFWARHQAGIGAPALAKKVGCGQALISNIENHGAKSSKFNDKFARAFGVDPGWLRDGVAPIPDGFNADEAKAMRERGAPRGSRVIPIHQLQPHNDQPSWAATPAAAADASDDERATALQSRILNDFQDYARLVGGERAIALVEILTKLGSLVAPAKKAQRDGE